MCNKTILLLLTWIDTIKDKKQRHRLHFVSSIATKVLINQYRQYKFCVDKGITPTFSGKCRCPGPMNAVLKKSGSNPHRLPDIEFQCFRTKQQNTGFNFDTEKNGLLCTDHNDTLFTKQYISRIANGCSI